MKPLNLHLVSSTLKNYIFINIYHKNDISEIK